MAGSAFVVAKDVFVMETVFWHGEIVKWRKKLFWCKCSYVNNLLYSVINSDHVKLR